MRKATIVVLLMLSIGLCGCTSNSGIIQRCRETKTAFTPFYERHVVEETGLKKEALEEWWVAWERWIQEYEK